MHVGLVGVGKMGGGIARRLRGSGHTVTAFDVDHASLAALVTHGVHEAATLAELVAALPTPRLIWLMIPAGHVKATVKELSQLLEAGDTVIDGGNSYFKDSIAHTVLLEKRGMHFVDVGVSGGIAGEQTGYALMVGGAGNAVQDIAPLFEALAAPQAYVHVGPTGAGHYVKMVHNAVEYGMMQAIGEGFDLLKNGPIPNLHMADVAELWSHGTIVRSYLMELAARALKNNESLPDIAGYVEDSGEGRWSVVTAVEHAVPFSVNTAALYARFRSRQEDSFAAKLVAALRKEFGGHSVKKKQ